MPTPTALRVNTRVVHRDLTKGRGRIVRVAFGNVYADVLFDKARSAVTVELRDLEKLPAGMPVAVDAGQAVVS